MSRLPSILLLAVTLAACGDKEEDSAASDGADGADGTSADGADGTGADGTDGTTGSTEPDCSACGDDQLCWYTIDFDDAVLTTCAPWPDWCAEDQTCDCIDTQTNADGMLYCDTIGGAHNSNACEEIDGRPVLFCETRLGR